MEYRIEDTGIITGEDIQIHHREHSNDCANSQPLMLQVGPPGYRCTSCDWVLLITEGDE